jgi:hypothetical protein
MEKWSRKYDDCINCGTQRRPHRGKGYCTKCNGPATQLATVNSWDCSRPETLVGYPVSPDTENEAARRGLKNALTAELRQRLDELKFWESSLGQPPEGITVEHRLRRIAQYTGVQNKNLFFGTAGYLEGAFNRESLTALNDLLIKIEEDIPWKVNWNRVLSHRRRSGSQ